MYRLPLNHSTASRLSTWLIVPIALAIGLLPQPAPAAPARPAAISIARRLGDTVRFERGTRPTATAAATCDLPPPTLLSPADAAMLDTLVPTYVWGSVPDTFNYEIEIASTPDFSSLTDDVIIRDSTPTNEVDHSSIDNLAPNTKYYWRVASRCDDETNGSFSSVFSFRSGPASGFLAGPPAPQAPADGATTGSIRVVFPHSAVAGANGYQIRFYASPSDVAADHWFLLSTALRGDSGTFALTFDPQQKVYWRMRSRTAYGYGDYSTTRSFTTPPVSAGATISPQAGGTLTPDPGNISISFPPGAVAGTTTITYTLQPQPNRALANFRFAGRAFTFQAAGAGGAPISHFEHPYTLTIQYDSVDLLAAGIGNPSLLNLVFWNGSAWQPVLPCAGCSIDLVNRRVTVVLDHFTEFALVAPAAKKVYVPLVGR